MRSVEFHPEAEDEFISAARFYEDQTTGLLYRVEPERIYIVAVMHLRRRPGYWRYRL